MARNILPEAFIAQQQLLNGIAAKHTADGTKSVLTPFLTRQNIDLAKAVLAGKEAAVHEQSRLLLSGSSETQRRLRDNMFAPAFASLQAFVQFLKKLFKNNPKELTQWGITISATGKITYPASFEERAKLFTTFITKHTSYAEDASPLQPYLTANEVDLVKLNASLIKATDAQKLANSDADKATVETALRDQLWLPVFKSVKEIGSYLLSLYSSNPKKVTAWGFDIVESASKQQLRTTTLKLSDKITITSIVIGGTFTNTGKTPLHLYKGKTTTGTPVIIAAGEQMGVVKGFSTTTIVNPSVLETASFTVLVNK